MVLHYAKWIRIPFNFKDLKSLFCGFLKPADGPLSLFLSFYLCILKLCIYFCDVCVCVCPTVASVKGCDRPFSIQVPLDMLRWGLMLESNICQSTLSLCDRQRTASRIWDINKSWKWYFMFLKKQFLEKNLKKKLIWSK